MHNVYVGTILDLNFRPEVNIWTYKIYSAGIFAYFVFTILKEGRSKTNFSWNILILELKNPEFYKEYADYKYEWRKTQYKNQRSTKFSHKGTVQLKLRGVGGSIQLSQC